MTKEEIEAKIDGLIDDIIDAERDCENSPIGSYRARRNDAKDVRRRVMDTLIEMYVDR
jgi:hypothetical protein